MSLVLTLSKYVLLKYRLYCVKALVFHASVNFQFYNFDACSVNLLVCHSRESFVFDNCLRALYKEKILWVKSNLWSSQEKTIEIQSHSECLFMLNFLSSPVLYTKSKYVSYVWTVLCLCILTASNITELYIYIYIIFCVLWYITCTAQPPSPCTLPWWKQICHFVSIIWVEHLNVLCDGVCESCVWIVRRCLIDFWGCYFVAFLNCILFGWTIYLPV